MIEEVRVGATLCLLIQNAFKRMDSQFFNVVNGLTLRKPMDVPRRRGCEAALFSRISKQKRKIGKLEKSVRYFRRRCAILETILGDIESSLLPPKSASQQETFFQEYKKSAHLEEGQGELQSAQPFYRLIVDDMLRNSERHPNGRRWSFAFLMLSFIVRSLGNKGYEYLRSFVALPTRQTLTNTFGLMTNNWSWSLLDVRQVRSICDLFRRRHKLADDADVEVVIGVDAITIEPVVCEENTAHVGDNHVFMFELLPLSCAFKPLCIHLMTQNNGNAGETVLSRMKQLRTELERAHFRVRCVASDGDRGYDTWHRAMINEWFSKFNNKGIEAALETVRDYDQNIVSDFLHLLKNARSRMLNGRVSIFCTGAFPFTAASMNETLHLGIALTDQTSKGRMRDSYALQIFTLENFLNLFQDDAMNMAFFILPYALWNNVINNPGMSCQLRREFLVICLDIFAMFASMMSDVNTSVVSINKTKNDLVQFACSENHCRRALNTLIVQLLEIGRHPDDLAMDRLGTHPLECCFGMIRLLCSNKHNWKHVLRAFSKVTVLTDLAVILGKPIVIRERVNSGGIKITSHTGGIYVESCHQPIRQVYEYVTALLSNKEEKILDEAMIKEAQSGIAEFVHYIERFVEQCKRVEIKKPQLSHGSGVSNTMIMARIIAFCQNPEGMECEELPESKGESEYCHPLVIGSQSGNEQPSNQMSESDNDEHT